MLLRVDRATCDSIAHIDVSVAQTAFDAATPGPDLSVETSHSHHEADESDCRTRTDISDTIADLLRSHSENVPVAGAILLFQFAAVELVPTSVFQLPSARPCDVSTSQLHRDVQNAACPQNQHADEASLR